MEVEKQSKGLDSLVAAAAAVNGVKAHGNVVDCAESESEDRKELFVFEGECDEA